MAFSKHDLDTIKSKIPLSTEIEKKTKIVKKGKDSWCCCLFHDEKTPSCKINDDLGSYYCFGCGAKGDIFSLYTDFYNYSFLDAVKELSKRAGVNIDFKEFKTSSKDENVYKILELSTKWFEKNLHDEKNLCREYLESRNINIETIKNFRLGYSFNKNNNLYKYLKDHSFADDDLLKSNVVKYDKNKKIKDFFYKRLIFPISNLQGKIVGFGGRVLDESNPKYINSPESRFFQKRYLLYNLDKAKNHARKKNSILICEGYMDVITLYQNGFNSIVAPLGTALTEDQLFQAWRYADKPTIMFDGDGAGLRASYKTAIMSLPLLQPNKFLQFIRLPNGLDPDSFLEKFNFKELLKLLKKPIQLVNFVFEQSSQTLKLQEADEKIVFDKYLDDIVSTIKDKKIQYFYRNEFKSLFFQKIKNRKNENKNNLTLPKASPLIEKQVNSFFATILNHNKLRSDIIKILKEANFLDITHIDLLDYLSEIEVLVENKDQILHNCKNKDFLIILNKSLDNEITQLFPYSNPNYGSEKVLLEVQDSVKNLNTRLLKLKKINKSLDTFVSEANSLNWEELQRINTEILKEE